MISAARVSRSWACLAAAIGGLAVAAADPVPQDILADLRSEKFADRQAAEGRLRAWARGVGAPAADEIHRLYREAADPEISARCLEVLRGLALEEYQLTGIGFMGVRMDEIPVPVPLADGRRGVGIRVVMVQPDTPAEKAGIQAGDLLLGIDGHNWVEGDTSEKVTEVIKTYKPGSKVIARLARKDQVIELPVVLGRRPASADILAFGFLGAAPDGLDRMAEEMEKAEQEAFFRRWLEKKKKNR